MTTPRHATRLTDADRTAVERLASAAASHDGTEPLNEEARLALAGRAEAEHWVVTGASLRDGRSATSSGSVGADATPSGSVTVIGYAQWQPANASGQLVVHPDHRRRGVGAALLRALADVTDAPAVWAFGDLPAAQGFAAASGLVAVRGLLVMERVLGDIAPVQLPEGVTLRGFTWADADAFLATNAAAFAGHPEQGHFSRTDLEARAAEGWFDPDGLILAVDGSGVLGFHWTKRHDADTGEVYVIGVHPRAGGRGLGRVLLDAGLQHLAAQGVRRVILYVDADNERAVELYERSGFTVFHRDTLYGRR